MGMQPTASVIAKIDGLNHSFEQLIESVPSQALRYAEEAHLLSSEVGYIHGMVQSQGYIGMGQVVLRLFEEGRNSLMRACELATEFGDKSAQSIALNSLGNLEVQLGNLEKAKECFVSALELESQLGNIESRAFLLNNLAQLARQQDDLQKAIELQLESKNISELCDDQFGTARSWFLLGNLYMECDDGLAALEAYRICQTIPLDRASTLHLAALTREAACVHNMGQSSRAEALYYQALSEAKKLNNTPLEVGVLQNLAELFESSGRFEQAEEYSGFAQALRYSPSARTNLN